MTNNDCINILRKVRIRAQASTPTQLLDYIDGQIDALSTMSNSSNLTESSIGKTHGIVEITPCVCPDERRFVPDENPTPRFRGADMP
jgi:hypothetical protein